MLNSTELVRELVAIPGPPGREGPVRDAVAAHARKLGFEPTTDAKGNLWVRLPNGKKTGRTSSKACKLVVTAHMDEIALMVTGIGHDGKIGVGPLGGVHPWKWGEQPVQILASGGNVDGVLSFGCIHSNHPASPVHHGRSDGIQWSHAYVFTGLSRRKLDHLGIRPGTRIALHPERRNVKEIDPFQCAYFLDDRADLAAWLLSLESLKESNLGAEIVFAATASEEVGGEGAAYLMHKFQPDICIALEIGPTVPESPFEIDDQPTVWVTDSFSSTSAEDLDLIAEVCSELAIDPHWQALSRGGSDASCTAQYGLNARPITLGFPVENSHGLEIMHKNAVNELAKLTTALVNRLSESDKIISATR